MIQIRPRVFAVLMFLVFLIPVAAFAAKPVASSPVTIGDASVSMSAIQWQTGGNYDRVVLTVSGPDGYTFSKEFEAGRIPMLRLQDLGKVVGDGSYSWQLRAVPRVSSETKERLAQAREANDDDAARRIQIEAGLVGDFVRSGAFMVQSGSFVPNGAVEPRAPGGRTATTNAVHNPTALDIVQADDVIIQGSLCVGLDCVNNESFGFDTIRLKENNTRIKFDDTSTASGFPNHDWQLTANDSASGGANKFSIEDITAATVPVTITGSAPTNSIFVDSSGRLGLRTSTPVLDIHVATGNTPAMRLEQNTSGGFSAQTWDVAGNEANFFVRDVTGGSRLPFRIRPGAPTSSIDINASGNVGIGTASPGAKLDIGTGASPRGTFTKLLVGNGGSTAQMEFYATSKSAAVSYDGTTLNFFTNGTPFVQAMTIDNSGNIGIGGVATPTNPLQSANGAFLSAGGTWTNASSRALKQDICDLDSQEAMQALKNLEPVKFAYKVDPSEHHVGFIAEDVPDLVSTKDRKSLSPMDIVAVLTKVVQQQQSTIDELKARLEQIEKKQ
jgi:hypothetical protein